MTEFHEQDLTERGPGWPAGPRQPVTVASVDLPWDEAPGWNGVPWDRDGRPTLEEVLALEEGN